MRAIRRTRAATAGDPLNPRGLGNRLNRGASPVLPPRAVLYTFSDNNFWLIGVQVLGGVGAGIFGSHTPRDRRYHAWHGALQSGTGRGCHRSRDWRVISVMKVLR
jgi:hypothetical protein